VNRETEEIVMKQVMLTPAAGKRLIAKGIAAHPDIRRAMDSSTLVIIAGTTNVYIAQEMLAAIGQSSDFDIRRFFRGITLPPGYHRTETGRLLDESRFPGDIILEKGKLIKGKTIDDVAGDLREGDIILKGANALDINHRRVAVFIGNPTGGTIIPTVQALIGRRVRVIVPVGLEKRIAGNIDELALKVNTPGATGMRLFPFPGEVFTEIDAIVELTGASAELVGGGGVCGAEGCIWLALSGTPEQEKAAEDIVKSVAPEPGFTL
jgi:hypothetical protein